MGVRTRMPIPGVSASVLNCNRPTFDPRCQTRPKSRKATHFSSAGRNGLVTRISKLPTTIALPPVGTARFASESAARR